MKIRPVGDELLSADRRTDMTKLLVTFRNYANAPKHYVIPGQPCWSLPGRSRERCRMNRKTAGLLGWDLDV